MIARLRWLARAALLLLTLLVLTPQIGPAEAQTSPGASPFAVPGETNTQPTVAEVPGPWIAVLRQIRAWQLTFQRKLGTAVRDLRGTGAFHGSLALLAASFVYGVFHAAGPGHGKAVISTYVLTTERLLKRALVISVLAATTQAVTAIVLVYGAFLLLSATGRRVVAGSNFMEPVSYALVLLLGLYLLARAVRRVVRLRAPGTAVCDHCGHRHLPNADQLAQMHDWRASLGVILAIGIRPCTGAIFVLVLAYGLGLHFAGVASAFAMAGGTALTVAAFALLACGVKTPARWLPAGSATQRGWISIGAQGVGGLVIVFLGSALLWFALTTPAGNPLAG